ncbi:MAG: AAA family ATPase [Deltaproteobacteria bacterium]|nr:AAA family ATPase [Deltaproteobacteria bacterium]
MRCSKCGFDNPGGMKFCGQCTTPLALICPNCHFENPPGFKFCGQCTTPLGSGSDQPHPSKLTTNVPESESSAVLDGERKTVTALFADIRGSTELLERLDPEEARALIDPALKLMIDAVTHYDGYIVQSTGDGIFALFGAPVAHEDHPQRALYAALRLQGELNRYSAGLRARGGPPIEARVGVNTGEVVVRSIQTGQKHSEYAPVGHTANLASRMQTIAASGSIVITASTSSLVEGYFRLHSLGQVTLKGIAEPVNAFEVLGLGPLRTRLQRAVGRGLTKFIGREAELKQMKHALELARQGHGQIVAAMGDPGVGKSRLFYEFKAISQAGNLVLEAYSVSHGKASAYLPVTEMLRDYFRIVPEDDLRQRREKVAGKIVILDRALEDTLPYLYALLGVAESDSPLMQIDTVNRQRRTCDAIKRVLLRETLNQPVIMIVEDLHWIDNETQALLDTLAGTIASSRVLLLVNFRPEYRHEWGGRTYYTQLRLDPLSRESADEMLSELLGDEPELIALKRTIARRTEGNPFFIEEIEQSLFEQGVLTRNGKIKLARAFSETTLPTTVQGILSSRIDRLAPKEKELLQTLATIGRDFPLSLAKRVANCSDAELDQMLAYLQSSEFIYEQATTGDVEYTFKHALTQEVAYKSLLIERRKLLHQRIGDAMESLFVDRLDDHLKDIAHHYRLSGNAPKAIEYLRRAGEQAVVRGFYEEAMAHLNSALGVLQNTEPSDARDGQELAIRTSLMAPLLAIRAGGTMEILNNSERLFELCKLMGQARLLAEVLAHLFFSLLGVRDWERANDVAHHALELAEHGSDEYQIFSGYFLAGFNAAEKGEYFLARQLLERACGISDQTQAAILANSRIALALINCIGRLAIVLWILGYPDQARRQKARLVTLLRATLDNYARALAISHVLTTHYDLLRDEEVINIQADDALAQANRSGHLYGRALGLISLGRIMVAEGRADAGIEQITEGMSALESAGDLRNYYVFSYAASAAYLKARHIADGLALVERAISSMSIGGVRLFEADFHRIKGEFVLMAGRPESEAEAAFREAIEIARRGQAKSFELRATMSLARLLAKQGRRDEARAILADIYGWFTEGFDTADLKDARTLLDELGM